MATSPGSGSYDIPVRRCPNQIAPLGPTMYKDSTCLVFTCIQPCTHTHFSLMSGELDMGLSHARESCRHQDGGRDSCEEGRL